MITTQEILDTLDHCNDGYYCSFVDLGHGYSYLIDARLNVFRADDGRWAIAVERLGYNPRSGAIILDIHYFGNCLINLEYYNQRPTSYYSIYPIDAASFDAAMDGEVLKSDAISWLVRGQEVPLSHHKQDYLDQGIALKEYQPNEISAEEAGRLVIMQYRPLFRATEEELRKSIPADLNKILVLDEWFHKDFPLQISPMLSDAHLRQTYALNKNLHGLGGMSFEDFARATRQQAISNNSWNKTIWDNQRPSSYETWQQIAEVIVTNDPSRYRPTLAANTHWSHWPESGGL